MAPPYTITSITDIPATTTNRSVLLGEVGEQLDEPSRVKVYATRESVDVTMGISLGRQIALPVGSATNINAAVGTLPSRQDDLIFEGFGDTGDNITIQGQNVNAAAQELRLLIDVVAIDDLETGLIGGGR